MQPGSGIAFMLPKHSVRILVSIGCCAILTRISHLPLRAEDKNANIIAPASPAVPDRTTIDVVTPSDASIDIAAPFDIQVVAWGANGARLIPLDVVDFIVKE
jgi:hypothetical protein